MNNENINLIFEQLNRLLVCGAVMAGGGAMAKYNKMIWNSFSEVIIFSGIIVALIGLVLTIWVATDGLLKIEKVFQSKLKGFFYGGLYVFLSISMVLALFFSAINTNQMIEKSECITKSK